MIEFGVLGPLTIRRDGEPVELRATMLRRLLALLLSETGQPVPVPQVLEELWGTAPPPSARKTLQVYVHRTRRELGEGQRIAHGPAGYSLAVGPDELDVLRFEALVEQARAAHRRGGGERASALFHTALGLWRGAPYADVAGGVLVASAARRLEERRLAVREELVEVDLELGRHAELVTELTGLVKEQPYREGLRAHLMLALYHTGRQAEALQVFRQTRGLLNQQLGVEPGPALQRLHEAILRGDERLLPDSRRLPQLYGAHGNEERCPYQGLMTFQPEQWDLFFGRAPLVDRMLDKVGRLPLVVVVGPSGSGKSSLLRAGLLATISRDRGLARRWRIVLMTPGEHPLEVLAGQVAKVTGLDADGLRDDLTRDPAALGTALATGPGEDRALLVVDQFEEAFTLCEEEERAGFVAALLDAAQDAATVVLGVRADFLGHVARLPDLVEALDEDAQLLVGPPSTADLREIVMGPAARVGLEVEAELLATVLADTRAEPGALPLVSHALQETWRSRDGHTLTLAGYRATGGVAGAIAKTAERVHEELDAEQRRAARRIFLRLTALGRGTEDTRRPIARAELDGVADPATVGEVLDRLAEARLIVLGERTVEVGHEALIRAWPRLRLWLTDDRADLLVHRSLTEAAHTWHDLGHDPGALYRGAQLAVAANWAEAHPQEPNRLEGAFLEASRALRDAEYSAVRRRGRLFKRLAAVMAALALLATASGGVAVYQSGEARQQRLVELAHQLSLRARSLLGNDPDVAGLLAVAAFRTVHDADTRGAVLSAAAAARRRWELGSGGSSVINLAFSPDGSRLASAESSGTVVLWDPARRVRTASFAGSAALYVRAVAFSRDGGLLASVATDPGPGEGEVVVRDVRTGRTVFRHEGKGLSAAMAFSGDGGRLAIGANGDRVEVWDVVTGARRTLRGNTGEVGSFSFSQDGRLLVGADRGAVHVWDVTTGERVATRRAQKLRMAAFGTVPGTIVTASSHQGVRVWRLLRDRLTPYISLPRQPTYAWTVSPPVGDRVAVSDENGLITVWDIVRGTPMETYQDRGRAETLALALSPDGSVLASAGFGGVITIRDPAIPPFSGHGAAVYDIEVSPDGKTIATAGGDGTVRLWDTGGRAVATLSGHRDQVRAVAFSPDGSRLAAVTRDHRITVWDVGRRAKLATIAYQGMGISTDIGFAPDARTLVTTALIRFRWDLGDLAHPAERAFPGPPNVATSTVFSPDGKLLVSVGPTGAIRMWSLVEEREVRVINAGQGALFDVAISPDGGRIATAGADGTIVLREVSSGRVLGVLAGHTAPIRALAFGRDGRTLASAGEDRTVVVWDLASGRASVTLTGHAGAVNTLAFTARGDLVSGDDAGRTIDWSLDDAAAVRRICAEVGRDLTPQEWAAQIPALPYSASCAPRASS